MISGGKEHRSIFPGVFFGGRLDAIHRPFRNHFRFHGGIFFQRPAPPVACSWRVPPRAATPQPGVSDAGTAAAALADFRAAGFFGAALEDTLGGIKIIIGW